MEIGIIGAGAVGMLFAAYLGVAGPVSLYTRTNQQAETISLKGIRLKSTSCEVNIGIRAFPIGSWKGSDEVSIIAVKQYHLPAIIDKINQMKIPPKNLLFIQNGMGHLKWLSRLECDNVFVGSVEHGALREDLHTVRHNGAGHTNVAVFKGNGEFLLEMAHSAPENFPVNFCTDYKEMLTNKLIVNAVVNPLTALLNEENGALIANHDYFRVLNSLFAEIAGILNIPDREKSLGQIISICKNTKKNRSSMLKDFEAGNPTEIDAILGYIIEEAKRQEKKALQVENLYYLLRGKEKSKALG